MTWLLALASLAVGFIAGRIERTGSLHRVIQSKRPVADDQTEPSEPFILDVLRRAGGL